MTNKHRERIVRGITVSSPEGDGVHCPRCGKVFTDVRVINGYCAPCYYSLYQTIRAKLPDVVVARKEDRFVLYHMGGKVRVRDRTRRADRALRLEVVAAYGGQCKCCGEDRPEFLTIDHINGGGLAERKKVGRGSSFYRYLRRLGFPKSGYRLLCFNCNIVLGQRGFCPHQDEQQGARAEAEARAQSWYDVVNSTGGYTP